MDIRRDFGVTWKERRDEARARAATPGPRLSPQDIAELRRKVAELEVSSPQDKALLWSGRDIVTAVPLEEDNPAGPRWWDKLACREAEVFSQLRLSCRLEDTPGGQFLVDARLHYPEDDPLSSVARELWETLSIRFVRAATGRVEIIAEGAFAEGVFRSVEFSTLLANDRISAVNGLDRGLFPSDASAAFALLRRWDVERSRRYSEFIETAADATPHERWAAADDFREIQMWYEQDFFEQLGPDRELPPLLAEVLGAQDRAVAASAWKYSAGWRSFIRAEGEEA